MADDCPALWRNENGKLRGYRHGRRGGDGFFRKPHPDRLAFLVRDSDKNRGSSWQGRGGGDRGGEPVWGESFRRTTYPPVSLGRTYELGIWWRRQVSYNWPDRAAIGLRIDF